MSAFFPGVPRTLLSWGATNSPQKNIILLYDLLLRADLIFLAPSSSQRFPARFPPPLHPLPRQFYLVTAYVRRIDNQSRIGNHKTATSIRHRPTGTTTILLLLPVPRYCTRHVQQYQSKDSTSWRFLVPFPIIATASTVALSPRSKD